MRKDSSYYIPSIKTLKSAILFDGLDDDMIDDILTYLSPMTLPKKSIIHYTTLYKSLFIILSGRVKVSKINPDNGREYIISILTQGDVFDIVTLLTNEEQEINIEAIDEIQLLETPIETAKQWLNENPVFYKNFLPYIGKRMKSFENAGTNLALYDTKTRLAQLILDNAEITSECEEYAVNLISDLSHETLAQMIGSVRKIVNLNIQELKKDEIIRSSRGNLSVLNLDKLKEICGCVT